MADTQPEFNFGSIYIPQLKKTYTVSKSEAWDYYQTNSGMYPKNPWGGGGGGGDLDQRVARLETTTGELEHTTEKLTDTTGKLKTTTDELSSQAEEMAKKAKESSNMLSSIKTSADIEEIEDIITNQSILSAAQQTILNAMDN